jgi:hypothetical protein
MLDAIHERLDEEISGHTGPTLTLILVALLFFGLATVGASVSARFGR